MDILKIFTAHPQEHNITYIQHMVISLTLSMNFFVASIQALIHAFFPFIFETSSSDTILYCENIINRKSSH